MLPERFKALLPKKKTDEELNKHYEEVELEKGDFLAMVLAALITFLPVLLIVIAILFGVLWLVFGRFI